MAKTTRFNFPVDSSRLIRAIDTPDDIGAVIRIHFEIDRALEHIIGAMVPSPSHLGHRYMGQRIAFLRALGAPEDRLQPVAIINEIRNKFAHHEKEGVTSDDLDKLAEAVRRLIGRNLPTHFALVSKKAGSQREWTYGEMSNKEKFCVLGYFVLTGIATIENDYEKIAFKRTRRAQTRK